MSDNRYYNRFQTGKPPNDSQFALTGTCIEAKGGAKWGGGPRLCPGIFGPSSAFSSSLRFRQAGTNNNDIRVWVLMW